MIRDAVTAAIAAFMLISSGCGAAASTSAAPWVRAQLVDRGAVVRLMTDVPSDERVSRATTKVRASRVVVTLYATGPGSGATGSDPVLGCVDVSLGRRPPRRVRLIDGAKRSLPTPERRALISEGEQFRGPIRGPCRIVPASNQ